ncbi:hypothetical protein QM806_14255 [Rhodococcus sp. IEGM 1351]|uniref:hypothetical protein n=1 Tax=Rhodococcus sp. IEGM 1351 TaxID=3047089 RepID=UPI0024B7BC53|nr:hypothetical protein [Rhodococcus sp. IEGM 1351]MDI9936581.1 hypothetical protein [Rhodococcus sp. IEGM 1351]
MALYKENPDYYRNYQRGVRADAKLGKALRKAVEASDETMAFQLVKQLIEAQKQ